MAKWWEIQMAIQDAQNNVDWAKQSVSEYFPENAPKGFDPELEQFWANLNEISKRLKAVFTPEIKKAIDDEAVADDEAEALADAASY